jgi:GntR family transcriptional regulator
MLNTASPLPLYHQLAELLGREISAGRYLAGDRIPSEHELAERYGVGRPTVRQATDVLIRRRMIERRRGAGTFVLERAPEVDLFSLAGTLQAFRESGVTMESSILDAPQCVQVPDDAENPFAKRAALFLSRSSRVDGRPVLLEKLFFHPELFAGLEGMDVENRSLSRLVEEQFFMRPLRARQNFRLAEARGAVARVLGLRAPASFLLVTRLIDFQAAAGAIYSQLFCRTDRLVFSQTIESVRHG